MPCSGRESTADMHLKIPCKTYRSKLSDIRSTITDVLEFQNATPLAQKINSVHWVSIAVLTFFESDISFKNKLSQFFTN